MYFDCGQRSQAGIISGKTDPRLSSPTSVTAEPTEVLLCRLARAHRLPIPTSVSWRGVEPCGGIFRWWDWSYWYTFFCLVHILFLFSFFTTQPYTPKCFSKYYDFTTFLFFIIIVGCSCFTCRDGVFEDLHQGFAAHDLGGGVQEALLLQAGDHRCEADPASAHWICRVQDARGCSEGCEVLQQVLHSHVQNRCRDGKSCTSSRKSPLKRIFLLIFFITDL